MSANTNNITYNRAKTWQIGLFALNNIATNFYMFLMMYVSYYATGAAGIAVVLISSLLTSMRMFDAAGVAYHQYKRSDRKIEIEL